MRGPRHFRGHSGRVWTVDYSPDGRLALSGGEDHSVRLWDIESGREIRRFLGHTQTVYCVLFSPDGRHVVSGSDDRTIRLWDLESGKEIRRYIGHGGGKQGDKPYEGVREVCFSPDGRLIASAGMDHTARVWDVLTGEQLRLFDGHDLWVVCVAFSPDGRHILFGGATSILRLGDAHTGEELCNLVTDLWEIHSVAFSPDGRHVLLCGGDYCGEVPTEEVPSDWTVQLWDLETGSELRRFEGHGGDLTCAAFSPDASVAVSCGWDGTVRLWGIEDMTERLCLSGDGRVVDRVALSPDGRRILASGYDGVVRL